MRAPIAQRTEHSVHIREVRGPSPLPPTCNRDLAEYRKWKNQINKEQ